MFVALPSSIFIMNAHFMVHMRVYRYVGNYLLTYVRIYVYVLSFESKCHRE